MDAIVAKMQSWSAPEKKGDVEHIKLNAVGDAQGTNKSWAAATPGGSLELSIANPGAQGFIQQGKSYIVTIREAAPNE